MRLITLSALVFAVGCGKTTADDDGDGYPTTVDCDDTSAAINPGASESCDGLDNDCTGGVDNDPVDGTTYYADLDGDGHGADRITQVACAEAPTGFFATADDCDDLDATAFPSGTEVCDGVDNDCSGTADDGIDTTVKWYADDDHDGFGDPDVSVDACTPPAGYVSNAGDCDDASRNAFPGGREVCDEVDNDCDGYTDADDDGLEGIAFYVDADEDTYGTGVTVDLCEPTKGFATKTGDCDDTTKLRNPGVAEACDGADVDEDCDGRADDFDNAATGKTDMFVDVDHDGFGVGDAIARCDGGPGWATADADCDDANGSINPDAVELRNAADENCNAMCDEGLIGIGDLVVSEVQLFGPSDYYYGYTYTMGAPTDVQWFEVRNTTDEAIRLCTGWHLESDGTDESYAISSPKVIGAGEFFVFGATRDVALNGGVPVDLSYDGALVLETCNGEDAVRLWLDADGDDAEGATEYVDEVRYDMNPTSYACGGGSIYIPPVALVPDSGAPLDFTSWAYDINSGYAMQTDPRNYDATENDYDYDPGANHHVWCSDGDYHQVWPENASYYDQSYQWYGTPGSSNTYCTSGSGV